MQAEAGEDVDAGRGVGAGEERDAGAVQRRAPRPAPSPRTSCASARSSTLNSPMIWSVKRFQVPFFQVAGAYLARGSWARSRSSSRFPPRSQTRVGHCHVRFRARSAARREPRSASNDWRKRPGVFSPFRNSSSRGELPSKIPIRCSKLFWPASEASAARTASGTWPAKGIPAFFASSAIANTASRGTSDWSLTKSAPRFFRSRTARRPSSGVATATELGKRGFGPSSIGPLTTMRGPTSDPARSPSATAGAARDRRPCRGRRSRRSRGTGEGRCPSPPGTSRRRRGGRACPRGRG